MGDAGLMVAMGATIVLLAVHVAVDWFVIIRLCRRNRALGAMLRAENADLAATREQLRLARAELGVPKPFGTVLDRRKA